MYLACARTCDFLRAHFFKIRIRMLFLARFIRVFWLMYTRAVL